MSTLYLTEQGSKLKREGRRLVVEKEGEKLLDVPIFKIDSVLIFGNVQISTQALRLFLENGVETAFLNLSGQLKGKLSPLKAKNVYLRMAQYKLAQDEDFKVGLARKIVSTKITNCISILRKHKYNHPHPQFDTAIMKLRKYQSILDRKTKANTILGIEGCSAVEYFKALCLVFRKDLQFNGRNRRPPRDPVNALLSYGYVLVGNRILSLLEAVGFDPYIGFLHQIDYGRPSLALDILEEFRGPLVDRLVINLANRGILKNEDFEKREDGGVYLKRDGQKVFFREFEKWMDQKFRAGAEELSFNSALKRQVQRLALTMKMGSSYTPFCFGEPAL